MTTLQVLPEGGFCFVVTWPCQMVIVQSVVNPRMGDSVPFDPSAIAMFVTTSIVFWVLLAGVDSCSRNLTFLSIWSACDNS